MRLGGNAHALVEARSVDDLKEALSWADKEDLKVIMIGEGSNIVWKDEGFTGLIIVNKLSGIEKVSEDKASAVYKIASGEPWDNVVEVIAGKGLSGIEALSLIPGMAGATPVQNVGAYGQEIADTLLRLEAYDKQTKEFVTIENKDCGFSYRTSRFKTVDKGRFFIISTTLKLSKTFSKPPFYPALQAYLDENDIRDFTPTKIRTAVIAIRSEKMPDWHKIANNGSFFTNSLVSKERYKVLKAKYPKIVAWKHEDAYKISTGWLLEYVGLKGYYDPETGMATSNKASQVFINKHAKSTADLLKFKQKIADKVREEFGIILVQEPELLP